MADTKGYVREVIYHITYGTAVFGIVVQQYTKQIVAYAPIAGKTVRINHHQLASTLKYYYDKGAKIEAHILDGYIQ